MTEAVSTWLSSHGATAIKLGDNSFIVAASEGGAMVRPTSVNELRGSILFPLPSLPPSASHATKVAINFSTQSARVDELVVLAGGDELFRKHRLRKKGDFTLDITGPDARAAQMGNGLALSLMVEFEDLNGRLELSSVGLEVAMIPPRPVERLKFDSGMWSTESVRPWDQSRERTESFIRFSTLFSSPPMVAVSLAAADIRIGANV